MHNSKTVIPQTAVLTPRKAKSQARGAALKAWITGSSFRVMYDDFSGDTIPSSAKMVARYSWWTSAEIDRFLKVPTILIATRATDNFGDVLDVENGDATASQAEGWIAMRMRAGYHRPTIYTSLSNVPAVRAGTGKYVLGVDYDLWVASWTGSPHQIAGAAATQYANVGTLYDLSAVYDAEWPHRTASAKNPPPKPDPKKGPFRHVSDGTASLNTLAARRKTTGDHLAYVTDHYGTVAERDNFVRYLVAHSSNGLMPKGLVYYTTNK
jgi:hypothetical protein